MAGPTYDELQAQMARFVGHAEGDDPKVRKRLHILRAATELFARQGYRRTSVDEVAKAAGVAKGTVYSYFTNKVDLLVAAVALEKSEALSMMAKVFDATRPAEDRLREYIIALLVLPKQMPITTALLRGDQELAAVMTEMPPDLIRQSYEGRERFLGALIDEVARPHSFTPGELRDRTDVLSGLAFLSTHLEAQHVRGGLTIERYAEILADLLVSGLRGGRGERP